MKQNPLIKYWDKVRMFSAGLLLAAGEPTGIKSGVFNDIGNLFVGEENSPIKTETLGDLVLLVVQIMLIVAGSVSVIFLIIGGYRYIVAHGNEELAESAKKTMTSAVIGLVVITLAFAIISIIANILTKGAPGTGLIQ